MIQATGIMILLILAFMTNPFSIWVDFSLSLNENAVFTDIPQFLICYFSAYLIYCWAIYFIRRGNRLNKEHHSLFAKEIVILIGLSLLMRAVFFLSDPVPLLSDDFYRYWWDGKVQYYGINPFHYSPKDFPYDDLKDQYYSLINHPQIPAVYPPFSQAMFLMSYAIYPSIYTFKIMIAAFDLATIYIIIIWLRHRKLPLAYIIIYAWNPLVVVEFYHGLHYDSMTTFFIALTAYLYDSSRKNASLIGLAFIVLCKYFGLMFLPLYFRKVSWTYWLLFVGILALFFGIYYDEQMFFALINYGHYWKYNSFVYQSLYLTLNDDQMPKIIMMPIFALIYLYQWRKAYVDQGQWTHSYFIILGLFLLFTPVVHPWYLIVILPLLVIHFRWSGVILMGLIALSYVVLIEYRRSGIWQENYYIVLAEYIPFYFVLLYELIQPKLKSCK